MLHPQFSNLVGGRAGMALSQNGHGAHAAGSIRVNFEAFDLFDGIRYPSSRTNSPTSMTAAIYLGGHGR